MQSLHIVFMNLRIILHPGWLALLLMVLLGSHKLSGRPYEWTTFAGSNGGNGFRDGPVGIASFNTPFALAVVASGNVYLADTGNHTIRKIAPGGMVSTVAGEGGISGSLDGSGEQARFNRPGGIALDGEGNLLVADTGNHTIRKISPSGTVTTLAGQAGILGHSDGIGQAARFSSPASITVAPDGDLYVADTDNHLIRRITPAGAVTTYSGQAGISGSTNGGPAVASFNSPKALATDGSGSLYIADTYNCLIRKITPDGNVTTHAGQLLAYDHLDGIATEARFFMPEGIVVDAARNVYVADPVYGNIRRISATDGMVTTLAGNINPWEPGRKDGTGTEARFNEPRGLALANDGALLVADSGNHGLRKVSTSGEVTTFAMSPPREGAAVDAVGTSARFKSPFSLTIDGDGTLLIADTGNRTIRRISPGGSVSTFAGSAGLSGATDATGSSARFISPRAVAVGGPWRHRLCGGCR